MADVVALTWPTHAKPMLRVLDPSMAFIPAVAGESPRETVTRLLQQPCRPRRVILHIDCSTPGDFVRPYEELSYGIKSKGVDVWNARVADVRKRTIQAKLVALGLATTATTSDGPPHDRVIIKSNFNYKGVREWRASDAERVALGWGPRIRSPLQDAPEYIVTTRGEVPPDCWTDPQTIVERYIENGYGLFYRAYLVGERILLCRGRSKNVVARMNDVESRTDFLLDRESAFDRVVTTLLQTPDREVLEATAICARAYGLDYGCIDVVVDERGVPFIVDINPSPSWPDPWRPKEVLRHLREGLSFYPSEQ